jgi:hypothetical protein
LLLLLLRLRRRFAHECAVVLVEVIIVDLFLFGLVVPVDERAGGRGGGGKTASGEQWNRRERIV